MNFYLRGFLAIVIVFACATECTDAPGWSANEQAAYNLER